MAWSMGLRIWLTSPRWTSLCKGKSTSCSVLPFRGTLMYCVEHHQVALMHVLHGSAEMHLKVPLCGSQHSAACLHHCQDRQG